MMASGLRYVNDLCKRASSKRLFVTLPLGTILAAMRPSCSLITSVFSVRIGRMRDFLPKLLRSIVATGGDKGVAGSESYVRTKDSGAAIVARKVR